MKSNLFYTTTEKCERGHIWWIEAEAHHPEFFVCHPLDLDEINEKITERKLISVDSYPIDAKVDMITRISVITPVWNRTT